MEVLDRRGDGHKTDLPIELAKPQSPFVMRSCSSGSVQGASLKVDGDGWPVAFDGAMWSDSSDDGEQAKPQGVVEDQTPVATTQSFELSPEDETQGRR